MPVVSVLMPAFNAAATCDAALDSVAGQTLGDFEVVAVDDGSTDATPAILAARGRADRRVRVLRTEHAGLVAALNHGLQHCRGEFVARMDADDRCRPRRLELQVAAMRSRPDLSVVSCLVERFPAENVGEGLRVYLAWQNALLEPDDIAREIFVESPIVHPSAMMRRAELLALGGYRERGWPEDYDLWLRYHAAGRRFAKVPVSLFCWREHGARATRTDRRYAVENFLRAKVHYLIAGPLADRQDVVVWGAGRTGRRLAKLLERGGRQPCLFVDIAPRRIGGRLRRRPVIGPEELTAAWRALARPVLLVAVASRGARPLIRAQLAAAGLHEGDHFFCVA